MYKVRINSFRCLLPPLNTDGRRLSRRDVDFVFGQNHFKSSSTLLCFHVVPVLLRTTWRAAVWTWRTTFYVHVTLARVSPQWANSGYTRLDVSPLAKLSYASRTRWNGPRGPGSLWLRDCGRHQSAGRWCSPLKPLEGAALPGQLATRDEGNRKWRCSLHVTVQRSMLNVVCVQNRERTLNCVCKQHSLTLKVSMLFRSMIPDVVHVRAADDALNLVPHFA